MTPEEEEKRRSQMLQLAWSITPYEGARDPEVLDSYFQDVHSLFYIYKNPDDQRFIVQSSLRGSARNWWTVLKRDVKWEHASGQEVLDQIKKHYYPRYYRPTATWDHQVEP